MLIFYVQQYCKGRDVQPDRNLVAKGAEGIELATPKIQVQPPRRNASHSIIRLCRASQAC